TEARFQIGAVPASAANLVISELHYHPADPSPAEEAAGFGSDSDFEYLELMNIGSEPVSMDGVHFTAGLTFHWNDAWIHEIPAGGRIRLVSNAAAIALRHGDNLPVAGEFQLDSALSNGGERLAMADAGGAVIREMEYSDVAPW